MDIDMLLKDIHGQISLKKYSKGLNSTWKYIFYYRYHKFVGHLDFSNEIEG